MKNVRENVVYHTLRFLLFTVNIILDLAGFLVLAAGLGSLLSRQVGVFPPDSEQIFLFPETLVTYGSIVAFIALVGTLGVAKESQNLLLTNMVLLLILCAVELVAGTITYIKITPMTENLKRDMVSGMKDYTKNEEVRDAWDNMQRIMTCCGVNGPQDWEFVVFNQTMKTFNCQNVDVPLSCQIPQGACYTKGCYEVPYNWVSQRIVPIGISIMSLFMLQLLALLLAVILYGLRRLRVNSSGSEAHDTLLNHQRHPNVNTHDLDQY